MQFETRIALALMLILVILSVSGCGQIPAVDRIIEQHSTKDQIENQKDQSSSIPNFQGIADALGCVFAPQSCQK